MSLPSLFRRNREREAPVRREDSPVSELQLSMNRLFEDFWRSFGEAPAGWPLGGFRPSVDIDETDDELRVTAELPGVDEKDFSLELVGDVLTIRGEKREEREEEQRGWRATERSYGRFERHVPLPCEVELDKASASFKQGVLRVTLPKSEHARQRRVQIPVRAG